MTRVLRVAPRGWVALTGFALATAAAFYAFGLVSQFTFDVGEQCETIEGQRYDPDYAHREQRFFPLSQPCDAHHDLVPGYVNPVVVVALSTAVACLAMTAVSARASRAEQATRRRPTARHRDPRETS